MRVLGIETSCDETAAAIVDDATRVRSSAVSSQVDLHREYGGVVPEIASRAHAQRIVPILQRALSDAAIPLESIDAVAVTNRPGLIGSLLTGVAAAKGTALALGVPLIGVHHIHAHLHAPFLADAARDETNPDEPEHPDPYPALGLAVSGGHTAIYRCDTPLDITPLGRTIDDAVGEAFDKAASILGLPYPGGPEIDRRAQRGNPNAHKLPTSRLGPQSLDFSFSGLKTALLYAVRGTPPKPSTPGERPEFPNDASELADHEIDDFCAAFQHAAVNAITLKLTRAIERWPTLNGSGGGGTPIDRSSTKPRAILVGGGVAANTRLRAELERLSSKHAIPLMLSPPRFCLDNAAMIAGLAHHRLARGETDTLELEASPSGDEPAPAIAR